MLPEGAASFNWLLRRPGRPIASST
ncbi:hypothetical protein [Paenibacillus sp. RC84]